MNTSLSMDGKSQKNVFGLFMRFLADINFSFMIWHFTICCTKEFANNTGYSQQLVERDF